MEDSGTGRNNGPFSTGRRMELVANGFGSPLHAIRNTEIPRRVAGRFKILLVGRGRQVGGVSNITMPLSPEVETAAGVQAGFRVKEHNSTTLSLRLGKMRVSSFKNASELYVIHCDERAYVPTTESVDGEGSTRRPSTYEFHVSCLPIKYPQPVRRIAAPGENNQECEVRSDYLNRDAAVSVLDWVLHDGDYGLLRLWMGCSYGIVGLGEL